jgi:hypothetical protein
MYLCWNGLVKKKPVPVTVLFRPKVIKNEVRFEVEEKWDKIK